jgi:ferritin-like metal-binding protein YciE
MVSLGLSPSRLRFTAPGGGYKCAMAQAVRRVLERSLRELYDVESRLLEALPEMAAAASDPDLAKAFLAHAKVTEKQIDRLGKVFAKLDKQPRRRSYRPLDGLLPATPDDDGPAGDLTLIRDALVIEHVEAALYRHLMQLAQAEGLTRVVSQLEKSKGEEDNAASELEGLAQAIAG